MATEESSNGTHEEYVENLKEQIKTLEDRVEYLENEVDETEKDNSSLRLKLSIAEQELAHEKGIVEYMGKQITEYENARKDSTTG